jgi:FKBP-type peptidyl-prolyl cis-trans isomerase
MRIPDRLAGWLAMAAAAGIVGVACESKVRPKTEDERVAYSIGYSMGKNIEFTLQQQNIKPDVKQLVAGIEAALAGSSEVLTEAEIQGVLKSYSEKKQEEAKAEFEKVSKENQEKGAAFFAENRGKPGVSVLPSGVQYRVVKDGTGPKPSIDDTTLVHYTGRLLDGKEFDTTKDKNPVDFPVRRVIAGWQEALQLMNVGSKWEVWVPSDLAYGPRGTPDIPPNSVLWFEMELLEIKNRPGAK